MNLGSVLGSLHHHAERPRHPVENKSYAIHQLASRANQAHPPPAKMSFRIQQKNFIFTTKMNLFIQTLSNVQDFAYGSVGGSIPGFMRSCSPRHLHREVSKPAPGRGLADWEIPGRLRLRHLEGFPAPATLFECGRTTHLEMKTLPRGMAANCSPAEL